MNKPDISADEARNQLRKEPFVDEFGNRHVIQSELARGGQGVVFRTRDADLAVKQPLDASGSPDRSAHLQQRFHQVHHLPLPPRIPISLPLSILRDQPGYVMRLLNGMKPFTSFDLSGTEKKKLRDELESGKLKMPKWLEAFPDENITLPCLHYSRSGSTLHRLITLSKCASILARLHCSGLVYGDISDNNVFVGSEDSREVWLIDADNLRFERFHGGNCIYTPRFGAPEVVQMQDTSRLRSDCWAFAVLAFKILTLGHPFLGRKVLDPDEDVGGWDAEEASGGETPSMDPDEQAYAGLFPFIDDEDDDSNRSTCFPPLPRPLVLTPALSRLFQETFGVGRTQPHRRPAMMFWALELARASDRYINCPDCGMSYQALDEEYCPYCQCPRPGIVLAKTTRWEALIPPGSREFTLRNRLFHPFSLEHQDDAAFEAEVDWQFSRVRPVRGTSAFPPDLSFEFYEEVT